MKMYFGKLDRKSHVAKLVGKTHANSNQGMGSWAIRLYSKSSKSKNCWLSGLELLKCLSE